MMKKYYLAITLCIFFLPSCGKEAPAGQEAPVPVQISVSQPAFEPETKSVDETDLGKLSSLKVSMTEGTPGQDASVWDNVTFSKDTNNAFTAGYYWPVSKGTYNFYAANTDIAHSSEDTYLLVKSASSDIVCGKAESAEYKKAVSMTLFHPFARIYATSVSASSGYSLSNISITIVPMVPDSEGGTKYHISTGTWDSGTAGAGVTLSNSTGDTTNDFLMLPGKYKLHAVWTATINGYSETFENDSAELQIKAGKKTRIRCVLGGKASELKFGITVAAWTEESLLASF